MGQKAEDPGHPLNKGGCWWLAVLCEGRSQAVMMQETSFKDTRQPGLMLQGAALLPQEKV